MSWLLLVYRARLRVALSTQLQYRAELVIWLIGMVLEPLVYLVVWSKVASASGGSVGGYTAHDFVAYYLALMLVNHLTFTWIHYEFEPRVRQGQFSPALLRPVHPIHTDIADNVVYKTVTLVIMIPAALVLGFVFRPALHPQSWAVALMIPVLALIFVLRFLLEWTLGLAAFWTTRVNAVNQVYESAVFLLSGYLAPVSLLPGPARILATVLPFRWLISFPVELILGKLHPIDALRGVGALVTWLIVILIVLNAIWKQGLKRYSAVGS